MRAPAGLGGGFKIGGVGGELECGACALTAWASCWAVRRRRAVRVGTQWWFDVGPGDVVWMPVSGPTRKVGPVRRVRREVSAREA
nr:protein FAM24B isoform X1 [Globicephala melas]